MEFLSVYFFSAIVNFHKNFLNVFTKFFNEVYKNFVRTFLVVVKIDYFFINFFSTIFYEIFFFGIGSVFCVKLFSIIMHSPLKMESVRLLQILQLFEIW